MFIVESAVIDLHMKHLNRNMMGNSAIQRIAKSLSVVDAICRNFKAEAEVSVSKGYYSYLSFAKDLSHVLEDQKVSEVQEGRTVKGYRCSSLLSSLKWKNITAWVNSKLLNLQVYSVCI